jgi:hypothetical protein
MKYFETSSKALVYYSTTSSNINVSSLKHQASSSLIQEVLLELFSFKNDLAPQLLIPLLS